MRAALVMVLAGILYSPALLRPAQFPNARQALDLGRTRDAALLEAFNRGYELPPNDAVDRAEIVTEFRRAVLLVRDQYNIGDFGYSERDLAKAMQAYEGTIAFVAEVRLNPLHTYPNPPAYELYISTGPASKPLATKSIKREPIYPPGLGLGTAFVGVRLEAAFTRADIERAVAPMLTVVDEHANILWQARIELSRYR